MKGTVNRYKPFSKISSKVTVEGMIVSLLADMFTLRDFFLMWAGIALLTLPVALLLRRRWTAIADSEGLNLRHIPYKGVTDAMSAVVGGTVNFTCAAGSNAIPMVQQKQLKALFTTGAKRHRSLPNVPTMRELEKEGLVFGGWSALVAPRGTPQAVLEKLNASVTAMMRSPDYERFTDRIGSSPAPRTLAESAELFVSEEKLVREIIRKAGLEKAMREFGYGEIAEIEGNKLEIDFEAAGRKRVMDSFVITN